MQLYHKTALIDLDGTVFENGRLDKSYLVHLASKYSYLVITSNNSSISHLILYELLSQYANVVLITPQLISKAILELSSTPIYTLTTFNVCSYLYCPVPSFYGYDSVPIFRLVRQFLGNIDGHKALLIVGKVSPVSIKLLRQRNSTKEYMVISMNNDKRKDLSGTSNAKPLLGDIITTNLSLCKTSSIYIAILNCILQQLHLEPEFVIGDNPSTDGILAEKLEIPFILRIIHEER